MRDVIEQEFRSHDAATPPGLIESASILTTTNLAMKSTMLGVIPESVASRYAAHGLLAILPYQIRHALTAFGSIVPRDRPLSAPARHSSSCCTRRARRPRPALERVQTGNGSWAARPAAITARRLPWAWASDRP